MDILDLKGLYRGTPVDVETDPVLYRNVSSAFPDAYLEDPDLNDETRRVLDMDRVTWDAPLESLADIERLEHKPPAINSKPSRFGSLQELMSVYEYCDREEIAVYGGGQGELGVGQTADPVPRLALPPRNSERRRAVGLQRPERPGRTGHQPARAPAGPMPASAGPSESRTAAPCVVISRPGVLPRPQRPRLLRPVRAGRWELAPGGEAAPGDARGLALERRPRTRDPACRAGGRPDHPRPLPADELDLRDTDRRRGHLQPGGKIDDIVDHIEEAADFMGLYGIEAPMEQAVTMADVLVKASEQLATLLEHLRGFKDLDKYWIEIHRLENDGDRLFREALASLFARRDNRPDGGNPLEGQSLSGSSGRSMQPRTPQPSSRPSRRSTPDAERRRPGHRRRHGARVRLHQRLPRHG